MISKIPLIIYTPMPLPTLVVAPLHNKQTNPAPAHTTYHRAASRVQRFPSFAGTPSLGDYKLLLKVLTGHSPVHGTGFR